MSYEPTVRDERGHVTGLRRGEVNGVRVQRTLVVEGSPFCPTSFSRVTGPPIIR